MEATAIALVETSRTFEANVAVVRTQDDMVGALLDMRV
ncbi:flagellar basal body rod C-terminal domain-containing protein [Solidesulfovibrio aerotolerans]